MKRFSAIVCIPVLTSSYALAEVGMLDDIELSQQTGQAGLTIDTNTFNRFSEFEYLDTSMLDIQKIHVGGHGSDGVQANSFYTDRLDNLRINISLSDFNQSSKNTEFDYGFSGFRDLANNYLANGNKASTEDFKTLAAGNDPQRNNLVVDDKKRYDEGDLVIHYKYLDPWEKDGGYQAYSEGEGLSGKNFVTGTYQEAQDLANRAVDFKYAIDEIGLTFGSSQLGGISPSTNSNTNALKSAGSESTRLISNFSIQGYLGPHDLHIKEYEHANSTTGETLNDNGITWNSYFKVTDLDVYLDISGVQISDLQIHNNRGDLSGLNLASTDNSVGNSSFGFAHAEREIYQLKDAVLDVINSKSSSKKKDKKDGIAFNTRFKGDIDIHHFSFGDTGTSVGEFFITDMYFNSRLTITSRE